MEVSTNDILLDNILRIMQGETFGKNKAAYIVGGKKRLIELIVQGKISSDKPTNTQNGKWQCNAADVLMHCRNTRTKVKPKPKTITI